MCACAHYHRRRRHVFVHACVCACVQLCHLPHHHVCVCVQLFHLPHNHVCVCVQLFHLPISEAASRLCVSVSYLKKQCRLMGVERWPFRMVNSLNVLASSLELRAGTGDLPVLLDHQVTLGGGGWTTRT